MKKISTARTGIRRALSTVLCLLALLLAVTPSLAENSYIAGSTVRVGYMNHPGFIEKNDDGVFYGYGVEYLEDICDYTGWNIEYVYASWPEQLEMLEKGELDIVPMAQYSEERAEHFGYSRHPIGLMQCLLLTLPKGQTEEDIEGHALACDGKTIGIQRGSQNIKLLEKYAKHMGFTYKLVEYDYQDELEAALAAEYVDIIACEEMLGTTELRILDRFNSDPYYLITAKDNVTLLEELDYIIGKLNAYDINYTPKLHQKYFGKGLTTDRPYFSKNEIEFIRSCGTVTVALIPDSKPGAYYAEGGELTGLIPDIMNMISELSGISFDYVFIPSNLTPYDFLRANPDYLAAGVQANNPVFHNGSVLISDVYHIGYSTLYAHATGNTDKLDIETVEHSIGTLASFQALHMFIRQNYPKLTLKTYFTVEEGLQALMDGGIDYFAYTSRAIAPYLSNPRYGDIVAADNSFMESPRCTVGLNSPRNQLLIEIINKCISVIPKDEIAKLDNMHSQQSIYHFNTGDVLQRYQNVILLIALTVVGAVAILATLLLFRQRRYNRDITLHAEYDMMTGVYNRSTVKHKVRRAMEKDTGKGCAFLFVDIDDMKRINETRGTDVGDEVIKKLANILKSHFHSETIIGRIGGDDFGIFLNGIQSKSMLVATLTSLQKEVTTTTVDNGAVALRVSIGVSMCTIGECRPDELYTNADEALRRVKVNGKNGFAFYEAHQSMSVQHAVKSETGEYLMHNDPHTDESRQVERQPEECPKAIIDRNCINAISESNYKNIIEAFPNVALYVIEKSTHRVLYYNKSFREICPSVYIGMNCRELMFGPCKNCIVDTMGEQAMAHAIFYSDFYGDQIEITATKIMWENSVPAVIITSWPRTVLTSSSDKLPSLTNQDAFDYVTGGFSRVGFMRMMSRMQRGSVDLTEYAILFINIKEFKAVNEMVGYAGGDNLLRTVYDRIEQSELQPVLGSRSESDHFVFMVEKSSLKLSMLPELLDLHWQYHEKDLFIHCRCGIFMIDDSGVEIYKMLDRAKLAKEHIVDDYVQPYAVYEPSMLKKYSEQASAFLLFDNGIRNHEFVVYYQPVVDAKTERVVSAEALVRRIIADGTVISPGTFIPILERTGYISMLDRFVAEEVSALLNRQNDNGMPIVPISFNVSQKDFYDPKLMWLLLERLEKSRLPKGMVLLEVTESTYALHEESSKELLERLRGVGAKILLDDFGTGYSSFGMFKNYNFDRVKLDMSFVRQLDENTNVRKVVRSIVSMCHDLGVQVVAEGVETDEELRILREMNCDYIQGYYFSKPLDEKSFIEYLSKHY